MQLYLEGGAWFKKKSPLEKISFLVDWPLSERAIKCKQALWPEDDVKPLRPLYNFIWSTWLWQGSGLLTTRDSVFIPMYNKKYISKPEKYRDRISFWKDWFPRVVSFLFSVFLAEFPSGAWVLTKPANFAWASKIGPGRPQCLLSFGRMERHLWPA